jgi:hypothetical protein
MTCELCPKQVLNTLAAKFLSGQGGSCDKSLPGYSMMRAMGQTKDVKVPRSRAHATPPRKLV